MFKLHTTTLGTFTQKHLYHQISIQWQNVEISLQEDDESPDLPNQFSPLTNLP